MTGLVDAARSWWRERSGARAQAARARVLRASYLERLAEERLSSEQRVGRHLYHLMLYWSRLIGFLDQAGDDEAADGVLRSDLMVMVRLGTDLADADVRAHEPLAGAWSEYHAAMSRTPADAPSIAAVRHANGLFARVDGARRALGLLSRWEVEPIRNAAEPDE